MPMQPDGTVAREGTRIRHYIVSLRYHHPGEAFKIPGSLELAKMFGVARATVTQELKTMVEEGIIIGKRGIGTFTNPTMEYLFPEAEQALPLVGLICGDGRMFFHDHYTWSMLSRVGLELSLRRCTVSYITGPFSSDGGELLENFRRIRLSGLVWVSPPETLGAQAERFAEAGIPLVTAGGEVHGVPGTGYDSRENGRRIGRMLLADGCRSIAILLAHRNTERLESGIADVYHEAGRELEFRRYLRFPEKPGVEEFGREIRAGEVPDAVYAHGFSSVQAWKLLRENQVSPERCRLIVNRHSYPGPDFRGILISYPEELLGRSLARQMLCALRGEPEPDYCWIPCEVTRIRTDAEARAAMPPELS